MYEEITKEKKFVVFIFCMTNVNQYPGTYSGGGPWGLGHGAFFTHYQNCCNKSLFEGNYQSTFGNSSVSFIGYLSQEKTITNLIIRQFYLIAIFYEIF